MALHDLTLGPETCQMMLYHYYVSMAVIKGTVGILFGHLCIIKMLVPIMYTIV